MTAILDRLLATLDVQLHAFAVCEIRPGWRLVFDGMDAVIIHYVLAGTGALQTEGRAAFSFGPQSILIIPPGRRQSLSRPSGPLRDVYASDGCSLGIVTSTKKRPFWLAPQRVAVRLSG